MIVRQLDFYTDGAFSSKTEMGGWACICVEDGTASLLSQEKNHIQQIIVWSYRGFCARLNK